MNKVAIFGWAALDGSECGGTFAHFFEGLGDIIVGDVHRRHFEFEVFVVSEFKLGENLEDGAEFEWLAFDEVEFLDLRLRDGGEFLFGDGFFDALGNERLNDLAFDVFGETAANQGDGSLAGAETGDAGYAREFLRDTFQLLGDFVCGNLEVEFAAAGCCSGCFSHGKSFRYGACGRSKRNVTQGRSAGHDRMRP